MTVDIEVFLRGTEIFVMDHRLRRRTGREVRVREELQGDSPCALVENCNCRKIDAHGEPND